MIFRKEGTCNGNRTPKSEKYGYFITRVAQVFPYRPKNRPKRENHLMWENGCLSHFHSTFPGIIFCGMSGPFFCSKSEMPNFNGTSERARAPGVEHIKRLCASRKEVKQHAVRV